MDDMRFAEYEYYMKNRPHVVILGAGASCAAIPNGDKNGKRISFIMDRAAIFVHDPAIADRHADHPRQLFPHKWGIG